MEMLDRYHSERLAFGPSKTIAEAQLQIIQPVRVCNPDILEVQKMIQLMSEDRLVDDNFIPQSLSKDISIENLLYASYVITPFPTPFTKSDLNESRWDRI